MTIVCFRRLAARRLLAGLSFAGVAVFAAPASAAVYLIDHNTIEAVPNGSQGPGGTWNRYAAPADVNGGTLRALRPRSRTASPAP